MEENKEDQLEPEICRESDKNEKHHKMLFCSMYIVCKSHSATVLLYLFSVVLTRN